MKSHPYKDLEDRAFWKRSVVNVAPEDVDPVASFPFQITKDHKVATAGSCFAQHIARHLKSVGFNFYVTETAHPILGPTSDEANYGIFTARYGNIYTARQLLQLFHRAYDHFTPVDDIWQTEDGQYVDAFRPTIQPGGFATRLEVEKDREQHLRAVREAFENLDILVFTLGLTECWISKVDGAVYPVCPGVSGGTFSANRYAFKNLSVDEILADLNAFNDRLIRVNPKAKIVLTVSPVPLAASATGQHVLTATTLSKSILRVAADVFVKSHEHAGYFPSFEIITGSYARSRYFAPDLRTVTEAGVRHVMSLFLKHATDTTSFSADGVAPTEPLAGEDANEKFLHEMQSWVEVMCDEAALDK